MANVAHSSLTGADLHEPKGAASAASGTVYTADGLGSGSWSSITAALNFTGMIADFATPVAPTGWLECAGTAVSRSTYSDLFAAQTIQQSGTRSSGSAVITGLSSTTNMRATYQVGGSGIPNGTTISSVDSSTQITLSANATSSGTSTVIVSPWGLGDGSTTFNLPDAYTNSPFRRSRNSSASRYMGQAQSYQNAAHTHTGTSDSGGSHTHTGTTDSGGVDHTHSYNAPSLLAVYGAGGLTGSTSTGTNTGGASAYLHTHTFTTGSSSTHTHTFTTDSSGSSEARPNALIVLTCIKY